MPAWMEEEAKRRREVWERDRPQRRLAKTAQRRREPLGKRVHNLEVQLTLASTMAAGAITSSGGKGGGPDSKMPPAAVPSFSGEHPRELARLFKLLEATVERLERIADADPQSPLRSDEITPLLVWDYEGYSAADAAALEPLFGSAEAVRRARRAEGRKGEDGKPARDGGKL